MVLTYGAALMSCTSGLKSKCSWREEHSDSLGETDLAFWQGSEAEEELVALKHAKFVQVAHEYYGRVE